MYRKVKIKIRYSSTSHLITLFTLALVITIFLGFIAFTAETVTASPQQNETFVVPGQRSYYLTKTPKNGKYTLTACEEGYHMASLWEILDPSNLKYDTELGLQNTDSGEGPPSGYYGWVRTGYESNASSSDPAGMVNCNAWKSNNPSDWGSAVSLESDWSTSADVFVWDAVKSACVNSLRVWCVADKVGEQVYLPLVNK